MIDAIAGVTLVVSLVAAVTVVATYVRKLVCGRGREHRHRFREVDEQTTVLRASSESLQEKIEQVKKGDVAETLVNIMRGE